MKRYLHTPEEIMQALKEGKIVKDEYGRAFALKNGFIIQIYAGEMQCINTTIYLDGYKYYIECPKPLKLEVGKFYKTRDGRKALVYGKYKETNEVYPYTVVVVGEPMSENCVSKAGEVVVGAENIEDLVAPWEE